MLMILLLSYNSRVQGYYIESAQNLSIAFYILIIAQMMIEIFAIMKCSMKYLWFCLFLNIIELFLNVALFFVINDYLFSNHYDSINFGPNNGIFMGVLILNMFNTVCWGVMRINMQKLFILFLNN
jgi:hypothetical protein